MALASDFLMLDVTVLESSKTDLKAHALEGVRDSACRCSAVML